MKVYVCYIDYGYDGFSEPQYVYSSESMAMAWLDGIRGGHGVGKYEEMEIK